MQGSDAILDIAAVASEYSDSHFYPTYFSHVAFHNLYSAEFGLVLVGLWSTCWSILFSITQYVVKVQHSVGRPVTERCPVGRFCYGEGIDMNIVVK